MWRLLAVLALMVGSASAAALPLGDPIQIPLTLKNGLPFVTVTVKGKLLELYVDLGGHAAVALSREALARISVQSTPATAQSSAHYVDAFGGIHNINRFLAPAVAISGSEMGDLEGSELVSGPSGVDGYLGLGLLRRYLVVFDYPHATMRLYDGENTEALQHECPAARFSLRVDDNGLRSTLSMSHGPLLVVWDTGTNANVIRPSASTGSGQSTFWPWQRGLLRITDAALDGYPLGPIDFHRIEFKEPDAASILGYDFFKTRVVCFDVQSAQGGLGF